MSIPEGEHRKGIRPARSGPEVAILVIAGRDGDMELACPGEELAARGDDDRRVVSEAVARLRPLIQRGVNVDARFARDTRGETVVAPPGRSSGSTPPARGPPGSTAK